MSTDSQNPKLSVAFSNVQSTLEDPFAEKEDAHTDTPPVTVSANRLPFERSSADAILRIGTLAAEASDTVIKLRSLLKTPQIFAAADKAAHMNEMRDLATDLRTSMIGGLVRARATSIPYVDDGIEVSEREGMGAPVDALLLGMAHWAMWKPATESKPGGEICPSVVDRESLQKWEDAARDDISDCQGMSDGEILVEVSNLLQKYLEELVELCAAASDQPGANLSADINCRTLAVTNVTWRAFDTALACWMGQSCSGVRKDDADMVSEALQATEEQVVEGPTQNPADECDEKRPGFGPAFLAVEAPSRALEVPVSAWLRRCRTSYHDLFYLSG